LYAIALTYTASVVLFYVFARYRFPLVPVLMLLAAGGLASWKNGVGKGIPTNQKKPHPTPFFGKWAIAGLVLAGIVAYLPLEQTRIDRVSHYVNIGTILLRDPERWDDAGMFLDKALKESPESPAAHYGMGMLMALKQQPQNAIAHYRTAVEGWPDNADIRINFALALADAGDAQGAFREFEAAARLRPIDPMAYVMAGKLLLARGQPAEASNAFERALAIDPDNQDARANLERSRSPRPAPAP
jgi:tetratricopeptide (TPR) repeat protein